MADDKKPIDWERIELDYRAGILTLREIASQYEISHVAISKRAKKENWPKDLKARIQARAEALVNSQMVNSEVNKNKLVNQQEVIETNATLQANKILEHRKDIEKTRKLGMKLFAELEFATDNMELLEQLGELLYAPDKNGVDKLNELYRKVISLPQRSQTMKALSETLKTLISLEREAFGISEKSDTSITVNNNNLVQNAVQGFDLSLLTTTELETYIELQAKIESKEVLVIEAK